MLATRSMQTKAHPRSKLRAACQFLTIWFSAAVPVLLAGAEALKEQLPAISGLLSGWSLVAASVAISLVVAALRVRGVKVEPHVPYPALDAGGGCSDADGSCAGGGCD